MFLLFPTQRSVFSNCRILLCLGSWRNNYLCAYNLSGVFHELNTSLVLLLIPPSNSPYKDVPLLKHCRLYLNRDYSKTVRSVGRNVLVIKMHRLYCPCSDTRDDWGNLVWARLHEYFDNNFAHRFVRFYRPTTYKSNNNILWMYCVFWCDPDGIVRRRFTRQ